MPEYDNTPPEAKDLTTPATPDNTAPVARDLSAPGDNTPPTAIAINQAPDDNAPVAKVLDGVTPTADAPESVDLTTPQTPNNAAAVPITDSPISNINMPASFQPAFVQLTGGGNCLDSLMATAADVGKVLQGTVNGELKSYQVRAGTDATALPGIVRPANFNDPANAVVFVQL